MDIKRNFLKLLDEHPQITVVCFDFFDTLVTRTVVPEYTKRIASNQLGLILGNGLNGQNLYRWRRKLEDRLCNRNAAKGNDPEFNILGLAIEFYNELNGHSLKMPSLLTQEFFAEIVLGIELNVELRVQQTFKDSQNWPQTIRERGINTAIVSDFYIPAKYFQKFIDHHGFSNHIDKVFISADTGLCKFSGRLYEQVIESFRCESANILMIGDNEHSDIQAASARGLKTFYVDRKQRKVFSKKYAEGLRLQEDKAIQLEKEILSVTKRWGGKLFPEMAISLWRFTHLLFKQLLYDGVKNIFFLSKEGELLKKLFEQFQKDLFGKQIIEAHYLLVSRKSTFICSLNPLKKEDFSRLFSQYREIAPRDFLMSLNFSESESKEICAAISIPYEKRLVEFPASDTFSTLVHSPMLTDMYEKKRQYQRKYMIAYIDSFGVDYSKEGLNIVDVGWKGSIQDNIFFSFGKEVTVNGYYIGLFQPTNLNKLNHKFGILFSDNQTKTPFFDVYNDNRSLFEMLLTATHGSADGYYSKTESKLNESSSSSSVIKHSVKNEIYIRTLDSPEERRLYSENIKPIQKNILRIGTLINRLTAINDGSLPNAKWFAKQHARMVYRPSKNEIDFFLSLYHLENFGVFEFTEFKRHDRIKLTKRWENLKKAIENPEIIWGTGFWPPVILNRMGLRIFAKYISNAGYRRIFSNGDYCTNSTIKKIVQKWNRIKAKKNVQIAFLLGLPEISGGSYVIFEHAIRLKKKGYQVFILTGEQIDPTRYSWHPDAGELEWYTFDNAGHLKFDYAIATWWMGALFLRYVNADTYLYFIQSIESRFHPDDELANYDEKGFKRLSENSYLLPLPVITEARWIKEYLGDKYGHDGFLVLNGIRKDLYNVSDDCHASRKPGRLRVLVEGQLGVSYKNVEKTITLCCRSEADEVWLLTASKIESYPGVDRVFSQVPIGKTPPIYRSCDVLVKLSYVEGMFGPPLEMFHCGGTAIVYNVTGYDEYIQHEVNSLVVQTDDEESVIGYLNLLKCQPEMLKRLKCGALETARLWPDWTTSSHNFEAVLKKLKGRSWPNRTYLNRLTDHLWHHAENDIKLFKLVPFYQEGEEISQCYQVFWHFGEGFSERESLKIDFKSGKWVSLKTDVPVSPSKGMYLRIDPCMQIGVVIIEHISIYNTEKTRPVVRYDGSSGWTSLEIAGTANILTRNGCLIIESKGQDPQILLPPVKLPKREDDIKIETRIKFMSFAQAVRDLFSNKENST